TRALRWGSPTSRPARWTGWRPTTRRPPPPSPSPAMRRCSTRTSCPTTRARGCTASPARTRPSRSRRPRDGRRGARPRPRRERVVPQRGRGRRAAARAAWRPGRAERLPEAARAAGRPPPGRLLRPARLRQLRHPRRPVAVDGRAVHGRARRRPRRARARPGAPVRQLVGRHARNAVRARQGSADMTLSPEYEEAMQPFYRRHVCRLDPWPDYVVRSFARMALPVYHYMAGPSEFRIIGTLRGWDIMDRLGEIRVPALITCGEFDECRPVHTREVADGIPGSRLEVIPDASHLCFAERPDLWMPIANEFMAAAESA